MCSYATLAVCDVKYRYVGERYPTAIAVKRQCVAVMSNTHKATFNVFIVVDFWLEMVENGPHRIYVCVCAWEGEKGVKCWIWILDGVNS